MKTWQRLKNNPQKIEFLRKRSQVIDAVRLFFKQQDFLEVDTPLMVKSPGMEPYLEVFETTLLDQERHKQKAYLLTSPEYALKKLLVGGIPKLFQICKSFRNAEGLSFKHNPEFSIIEWYRTNASYKEIMDDCEALYTFIAEQMYGTAVISYQGKQYDLSEPWERLTVAEAFQKYAGIDTETLLDEQKLIAAGKARGFAIDQNTTWEQVYNQFFLNDIDPHLGQDRPIIIYDYPASQASLSKKKPEDPRFAERFEFFIAGIEMGNAFSELTDADEQLARFQMEQEERRQLGKTIYEIDMDYIAALRAGLPPTGGIAVGIDRMCMFFADTTQIEDVLVFPISELYGEGK
jgi:elongation factor P--(R)-beta-lysine ligase